jgi:formate dehydrogenase maturation protein FdhE
MWESIIERASELASKFPRPEFQFLARLFEAQQITHERFDELLAGEKRPLESGVLMASIAFVSKTYRELYPIIARAPEPFPGALAQLRKATPDDLLELLTVYFLDDRIPQAALQHLPDAAQARWFARVFLQPAAPFMLERTLAPDPQPFLCPRCKHRPQLLSGSKFFCSLCFFEWAAPDRVCPACGKPEWQSVEIDSVLPLVEIVVCPDCKVYLKRVEGGVPLVDELFSTDLDDRARLEGWRKLEPNLLLH